ncbi:MAG TPA: hypothetical protein VF743_12625, partial [Acidimicrobiales bacterium]
MTLPPDGPLVATRRSLHAVAEHVLAAALYAAVGRIGLRAAPGGFGTPPFPAGDGGGEHRLRVDGTDLVVLDAGGSGADAGPTRRAPLTTLRAAGDVAGIEPGAPADVYTPATPLDLDAPLTVDPGAARTLADWYALVDAALAAFTAEHAAEDPATVQLWPEHFDLATTVGRVNYGGSPGDDDHPRPYLYVGPHDPPAPGGSDRFWNEPFGASAPAERIESVDA